MKLVTTTKLGALLIAALATGACGGDEGGGGGGDAAKKAADEKKKKDKEKKKKEKKKKREEPVSYIAALENVVPQAVDKDGKPVFDKDGKPVPAVKRPHLTTRDFMATENRDPFRSYLLPQVADEDDNAKGPDVPVTAPTPECAKLQLVATSHSIDDLDLVGIIRRGRVRFAMLRDPRGVGHQVERGKCIGREKGKVVEIGESILCYEVLPEKPPDATAVTVAVRKCIALYPDDITDTGVDLSAEPDMLAPPAPPPAAPPAPGTTPAPPPGGPPQPSGPP